MDDFPANSHRAREREQVVAPEPKRVEKIVEGEVKRRKKSLGKRIVETFLGGDARSVAAYLMMDVLVPSAKDTIADMFSQGIERMLFGESRSRSRRPSGYSGSSGYVSYNRYSASSSPPAPRREEPRNQMSRRGRSQHEFDDIVLATRVEAEEVLDRLFDLISRYQTASVADFYEMVGESKNQIDERWGWTDLRSASIVKLRGEGYLINLPKPELLD